MSLLAQKEKMYPDLSLFWKCSNKSLISPPENGITVDTGFAFQSQIGWDMVLGGFVAAKWEEVATSLKLKGKWMEAMSLILATLSKISKRNVGSLCLPQTVHDPNLLHKFKIMPTY
jgi:hypothetical protein